MSSGLELGVVHLVRHANGTAPLERFLDSYRRHPAGAEHELVLLLKGFHGESSAEPHRELAGDLCSHYVSVPDHGFDLGAYRQAAHELTHRRLLFLNSFSVILAERWLELLDAAGRAPGVGAAAASGSWGSQASHVRYSLGLGGPYSTVFPDRAVTHRVFAELDSTAGPNPAVGPDLAACLDPTAGPDPAAEPRIAVGGAPAPWRPRGARRRPVKTALEIASTTVRQALQFPPFPAPHLRTNGLLIERERWLRVCPAPPRDKLAAHRLESGRGGVTARLRGAGLEAVVVGRDGHAYSSPRWAASRTFWQGDQENLLIGDNQTNAYRMGDGERRRVLSGYAWGPSAEPTLSVPA
jgi:hypothetical protein